MRNSKITPFTKFYDVREVMLEQDSVPWYVSANKERSHDLLKLAWEWVQSQPKTSFTKKADKKAAKQRCKEYIKEKYKESKSFSFFGGLLLNLIISAIINWIVRRLLDYLFE